MTPERWRQVTEIFHAALARDASARASYLDHACAGDRPVREEVEAMLAAHDSAGGAVDDFLETPTLELAARTLAAAPATTLLGRDTLRV